MECALLARDLSSGRDVGLRECLGIYAFFNQSFTDEVPMIRASFRNRDDFLSR